MNSARVGFLQIREEACSLQVVGFVGEGEALFIAAGSGFFPRNPNGFFPFWLGFSFLSSSLLRFPYLWQQLSLSICINSGGLGLKILFSRSWAVGVSTLGLLFFFFYFLRFNQV